MNYLKSSTNKLNKLIRRLRYVFLTKAEQKSVKIMFEALHLSTKSFFFLNQMY